ncbi:MAG TPA: hypothetical protein VFL69_07230 [Marmoricola sp.]|nr:hypothetical protein [Marmoricola sp.]
MTEEHPHDALHPEDSPDTPAETPAGTPAHTGHPAVDEVLRSMERLEDRPVDEHVAVFEQAHETLRRTLAGSPGQTDAAPGAGAEGSHPSAPGQE